MNELELCPCCGGIAVMERCDKYGQYHTKDIGVVMLRGREMSHKMVICQHCGLRTKAYLTERGAANSWNRRVDKDASETKAQLQASRRVVEWLMQEE